jgi:hypothetical protein
MHFIVPDQSQKFSMTGDVLFLMGNLMPLNKRKLQQNINKREIIHFCFFPHTFDDVLRSYYAKWQAK